MSLYQSCDRWEDPDCSPYTECSECEEKTEAFEDAAEYLTGILEEIYSTSNLDLELLEHNIENLCHVLNVKMPDGDVQVLRKPQPSLLLTEWMQFNHNYLKSCVNAQ